MTYSIGWPIGFKSRTSDPADPCFVGKIGETAKRVHAPSEKSVLLLSKAIRLRGKIKAPEMMRCAVKKVMTGDAE